MTCEHCSGAVTEPGGRCSRCGQKTKSKNSKKPDTQRVAAIYTAILIGWAVVFPFLVPIIIKKSIAAESVDPRPQPLPAVQVSQR